MQTVYFLLILLSIGFFADECLAEAEPVAGAEPPPIASDPPALALPPPVDPSESSLSTNSGGGVGSIVNTLGALALVVGVFLLVVWFLKRSGVVAENTPANEIVAVIARTQLGGGQSANVIRFGNQLLLVAQAGNQSQTLATITDADEVQRICQLCEPPNTEANQQPASLSTVIASFMSRPATTTAT